MLQCQGCMKRLNIDNRKEFELQRLRNPHANELCDSCLNYFLIIGRQPR